MMAKSKIKGKQSTGEDLIENPEVLAEQISKTEEFLEKNKIAVFTVGGVVALIVAAYFFYISPIFPKGVSQQTSTIKSYSYITQEKNHLAMGSVVAFLLLVHSSINNFFSETGKKKHGKQTSVADLLVKENDSSFFRIIQKCSKEFKALIIAYRITTKQESIKGFKPAISISK